MFYIHSLYPFVLHPLRSESKSNSFSMGYLLSSTLWWLPCINNFKDFKSSSPKTTHFLQTAILLVFLSYINLKVSLFSSLFLNWSIIALQCCIGFCHTTRIGHKCVYIYISCLLLPSLIPHPTPLGHLRAAVLYLFHNWIPKLQLQRRCCCQWQHCHACY